MRAIKNTLLEYSVFIVLFFIVIWNCVFTNNFFNIRTLWNAMFQCAPTVIVSMGMMLVIATGGIDISVGAMMAGAGMTATIAMRNLNVPVGILAGIGFGLAGGLIIGFFIGKYRIQAMIVTLSGMYIFRGIALLSTGGGMLSTNQPDFNQLTYVKIGGAPLQLFVFIFIVVFIAILVRFTRFGVYIEAYGDNRFAAHLAGINTIVIIMATYMISAVLASFAGLIEVAMATGTDPYRLGLRMELDCIAAVALGGTPMNGGRPRILGTVAGVFTLQVINMMINMNNISYAYSLTVKAIILVIALVIQRISNNKY
jgi:ribose/xylose/arabinose/galactoside ABC-type transport system permease subunit